MKSLALNLLNILLLLLCGAVLAAGNSSSSGETLTSVAKRRAVPTTTSIPPILKAPPRLQLRRHTLPATTATTKPHISTTTETTTPTTINTTNTSNSRQRLPIVRHAAKQITKATTTTPSTTKATRITTVMTNTRRKPIITQTSTLESTRLVQNVEATTSSTQSTPSSLNGSVGAGVRQQRSFHSNGAQPYEDTETKRKINILQRQRPYTRSYSSATTTTTGKPQHLRQTVTSQHSQLDKSNKVRQSKQSALPLQEDGLNKATANSTAVSAASSLRSNSPGNSKLTRSLHNQQTPKTPRMIQRLVAGHIQNAEGRSTYQVSAVTSNSTVTKSTATTKSFSANYDSRRPSMLSSSYKKAQLNANIRMGSTTPSTAMGKTSTSIKSEESLIDSNHDVDYHDDDEALLDEPGDFDNWDNGILRLSAGSGKENNLKPKKIKEDSKKTLADQVRDGKYGLIEKELFRRTPKRPGVLSYLANKEVPEDNERNFGGLHEEDIWLAEDHLLVIKGGSLNENNPEEPWPAIDDYNAAGRQIKIPSNPKIPPPFPVQLEENGPIQLIGNNKLTIVYPVTNESLPVYTIGTQAHNTATADDSDDEKNLITRPGKTKTSKEDEPSYNYASPPLPWLYNNQTVANPSLNDDSDDKKPINFPILGPFLYGRNGSLDNTNGTDDFDEDDPSLYYPPAYSFVYKSNYSNPVAPGPLVPGIVVPPPPEHFSKLEKSEKERRPWYSSTQSPPVRYRVYGTTTSAPITTTTTTTTTTTAEPTPYRQVVTKISQYTPKVINIVTPAPRTVYTPTQSPRYSITAAPTPPPRNIEPVPVPVAVPIPIYPVNGSPSVRPNIVAFVPTTPAPHAETLSNANPIYYDYFEAKRQHGSVNFVDDYPTSTPKPILPFKPIKLYATSKRPFKSQGHYRNYLHPTAPNHRYEEDNVLAITPKPEIRYKPRPIFKQRPLQNFEQEVNAIRETLRYYQNQELRDNNIPRTPKAKPVFDYNYNGAKVETEDPRDQFQPPTEYDGEPFKPLVTYSPAVDDENAFRALAVEKIRPDDVPPQGREDFIEVPKYPTTTLLPVQPQTRPKKLRLGAKYLQQSQQQDFPNSPQRQASWLSADKSEFNDYVQAESPPQRERYQEPVRQPVPVIASRNREFPGYYYGPGRQNNRFYEEPFQNVPSRKIINYRPQPPVPQQQQIWSLHNDTLVNELPNRPPLNPDAEFIDPYLVGPSFNNFPYQQQQQFHHQQQQRLAYQQQLQQQQQQQQHQQQHLEQQQQPPVPISHQSQYYARPHLSQRIPNRQFPHPQQQQQQPHPPYSLVNDELVNYRQPLPPINPDSEWITHPQLLRNSQQQFYRANNYRLPPPPPPPPPASITNVGSEADVFYFTPKYRRANNLSNSSRYQQQQQQQHANNNNNNNVK